MNVPSAEEKKKRPTISDVALLSGVAKATVSKALDTSSRYGLSDQVRKRVTEAAQQLGYEPRGRGRAINSEQARTVGLFYFRATPLSSELYERMIVGAAEALGARQCRFIHLPLVGEPGVWKNLVSDWRIVGGLVIDPLDPSLEALLRGMTLRCVFLNVDTDLPVSRVVPDLEAGAEVLARHLLEKGHHKIALITGQKQIRGWSLREEGIQRVMRLAGIDDAVAPALPLEQFLEKWPRLRKHPTAAITDTFATALRLLHDCGKYGIRVPENLSVASLEDGYPAELLNPPLTAMRIPAEQLGREAANLLLDQLDGEQSSLPRKLFVTESLVVRQSIQPASPK